MDPEKKKKFEYTTHKVIKFVRLIQKIIYGRWEAVIYGQL